MLSRKSIKYVPEMSVAERKIESVTKGITMWKQKKKEKNDSPLMLTNASFVFIMEALFSFFSSHS